MEENSRLSFNRATANQLTGLRLRSTSGFSTLFLRFNRATANQLTGLQNLETRRYTNRWCFNRATANQLTGLEKKEVTKMNIRLKFQSRNRESADRIQGGARTGRAPPLKVSIAQPRIS